MKILILGGTGYLSSALVEASLQAGYEVTVVTRGQRGPATSNVRMVRADRNDEASLRRAIGGEEFDAVIDSICFNPEQARLSVDLFGDRVARLVMISTDFVYSAQGRPLPTPETMERNSPSGYGRQKAAAEDVLLENTSRLPVTILRPPHIVGGGGLLGTGSLQGRDPALVTRLRRCERLILLDGGALLIQPADRRDIAEAALAAIMSPQATGQVYNVAGPRVVTSREYYEIIAEKLGEELSVVSLPSEVFSAVYPDRAVFAVHRAYDTSRLQNDTGWRAQVPLEESLGEMLGAALSKPMAPVPGNPAETALLEVLRRSQEELEGLLREV
jgi:nucleoside-diphosphate-sugar epimerase